MKKIISKLSLCLVLSMSAVFTPAQQAKAAVQTGISRNEAEQRALNMINLTWTYSSTQNKNISSKYALSVTQPIQFKNLTTAKVTGIPYNWGGLDSLDSISYNSPWNNFIDAINNGAYAGNVNTDAGYGYIPGTAGIDCSGFVQATFNINDYKLSTSTLFDKYFTKVNINDIKHMDILDRPGDHVVIFNKWGTLNGVYGAFTYESTPDQTYGGIQGTKTYFLSMNEINNGYMAGRYINITEDTQNNSTVSPNTFAQVSNVNINANFRSNPSITSSIIGTIPKETVIYLINYSSGWYQINYNNQVGWIYENLLSPILSGEYVSINNAYQLNIRSNPTTASSILGILSQNQYAKVIDYSADGSWYKISINGIEGWCSSKYLMYIY